MNAFGCVYNMRGMFGDRKEREERGGEWVFGRVVGGHLSQAPIKYPAKEHFTRFIAIFLPPHYALSG